MKVVLSARVEDDLRRQIAYSKEKFGERVAAQTLRRVRALFFVRLISKPPPGKKVKSLVLREAWIRRTPFVIFYRIDNKRKEITILALFHHAQDRSSFTSPQDT